MKKIFLGLISFILPVMVFGMTCDVNKDNQNGNNRNLTCDAEKSTATTFKTSTDIQVLKNDVCTVTCSEEVVFSIDPIKKVLAGTSFSYPLYVSGERRCKAVYNYTAYEAKIKSLVGGNRATLVNYYDQKQACDNFSKEGETGFNKYSHNGNVSLRLERSTDTKTINYVFDEISRDEPVVEIEEVDYESCGLSTTTYTCKDSDKTISGWTEISRVFGKYTMPNTYLEKYTGNIKETYDSSTCNAKDRYFVDFNEKTKPLSNDSTDKGYSLILTATELGNNLKGKKEWNLNVNCWYQVKNLIFPQGGYSEDEGYENYGNMAFQYRIIDLNEPFPNREPGANWSKDDVQKIILSTKDNLTALERFVITLNRSSIKAVRDYNSNITYYDTFNLDEMERSAFIRDYKNVVCRGSQLTCRNQ